MSLILEALKKSEQQRRLGEVPTFATPSATPRRRRSTLPFLLAAIALALGVGGWLMWRESDAPPLAETPAPPARTSPADAAVAPPPATVKPEPAARPAQAARAPVTDPTLPATVLPPQPAPGGDAGAVRLPPSSALVATPGAGAEVGQPAMPAREPIKPSVAAAPSAVAAPAVPPVKVATPTSPSPPEPGAAPARVPVVARDHQVPAIAPQSTVAPPAPAPVAAPASPTVAAPPAAPTVPTVWDLAYSVRKDLPPIALTMHVYSDAPQQRFVVVGGERHIEGDELGTELKLIEIRNDGMLLDFRGQRFLFPRDGR